MAARVLVFFNQKGGAGKTHMSVQVSGGLTRRGYRVLLIDMDKQGTALRWSKQASEEAPFPSTIIGLSELGGVMHREVKKHVESFDFIVIDCPPSIESGAPKSALLVADLALIPVVPSPGDLWASDGAKQLAIEIKEINEDLLIRTVPNMVPRTKLAIDALEVLAEDLDVPSTQSQFGNLSAFRECQLSGSTVHSVRRAGKAVEEVESLVTEVLYLLKEPQTKSGKVLKHLPKPARKAARQVNGDNESKASKGGTT